MSYTFEEIMAFHPGNKMVYEKIKDLLIGKKLVPFVGAGLTKFAYYLWHELLKELSNLLPDSNDRNGVNALIDDGQCLEAAQALEDLHRESNLTLYLGDLLSSDKLKLEQNQKRLLEEPISLLPHLFGELVVTTNYDQALETVYENAGYSFNRTFLPGRTSFIKQLLREGGARALYKLHGTVVGKQIDYESFVFTKTQYDERYSEDSALTKELKDCFKEKVMFFLGCSLNNDRTMELLQKVVKPGIYHYAIINCGESEKGAKIKQLADMNIRAIVYEGKRHEAVRVILEHLLEETDPEAYKALPYHVGALMPSDLQKRFSYKSDFIQFEGRNEELNQLNDFLGDPNVPFRWWAVTGPGGSGKSRLVYEFQKKHLPQGWTARYLTRANYENLASLTKEITKKELIIADYVQEHAKELGAWMEQLNNNEETPRSLPIRVLLVEREADDNQDNTSWTKQLYKKTRHKQSLTKACYQEEFLKLQPLGDDELLKIIEDYAKAFKNKALSDTEKQMLLDKLKSVDPDLCRPLYAMFLTDAYVAGKAPERWNKSDILDYVTEREQKRLEFNIEQVLGWSDENLYAACLHLLSMATVLQDASLSELQKLCPDSWKIIEQKAARFVSPVDMLEQLGLAVNGHVSALRPDLIGEYYVYTWLLDRRERAPEIIKGFLSAVWQKPASTEVFFYRLFKDYDYLLNESAENWELILPEDIPLSEDAAEFYAGTLVSATYYCNIVKECERQVKVQESITQTNPNNSGIAIRFAMGMDNLINRQDEQGAQNTIDRLERLANEHKDVKDIAVCFAMGLFNLSCEQDEQGRQKNVARLESLAKEYPNVPEIAIELAKGLANLSVKQDEQWAKRTIDRLESLAKEQPDVTVIVIAFANGLFNLSAKQDEQGIKDTVVRLESLAKEYPNVPEIAIELAKGLVNLSANQDEQDVKDTVARLESLATEYKDVGFTIEFAMGLANLSAKQNEQGVKETVKRLESLATEYKDVPEIAIRFAKGLVNLSAKQDEQGVKETVKRLESLATEYKDVPDIAVLFAGGLLNLSKKQDEQGAKKTIARLAQFLSEHPVAFQKLYHKIMSKKI